jgi:hypothetical protein
MEQGLAASATLGEQFRTVQCRWFRILELTVQRLCKIWGDHGGHYEECRLLRYKTLFVLHRRHITSLLQGSAS